MSHNDESFFREVDEEYRRDQAIQFFRAYGSYLLAGAFVILAVVAGYTFEQNRRASKAAAGGDALVDAMLLIDAGKQEEAQKALAGLAGSGSEAYRVLARLIAASESVAKNQNDAAREAYAGVAGDGSAPEALRDFANIQLAALAAGNESFEKLARDLDDYRSGTSRWRFAAKEILGLAAYKAGKTNDAERLLGEIVSDGEAPQGMRQRAEVLLSLLIEKPKGSAAGQTGTKDAANDAKTQ